MAISVAVAALCVFGLVALFVPGWAVGDRVMAFGLGVLVAALMWRYASIQVAATDSGLVVRNLLLTTTVPWDQIVDLEFPEGDPWPHLLLANHDSLAVMAVQRSDGKQGQDQARRLGELIGEHLDTESGPSGP